MLCLTQSKALNTSDEYFKLIIIFVLGENNKRLTEDELNMFISHAYRKVNKNLKQYYPVRIKLLHIFFFFKIFYNF